MNRGDVARSRRRFRRFVLPRPGRGGGRWRTLALLAIVAVAAAIPAVDHEVDRVRRDRAVKKGALNEALIEGNKATFRYPQAAEAHRSLGLVYDMLGRLPDAEKELRAALAAQPATQTSLDLASVLGQQKRSKEALQLFKRVLREEPNNPVALFGAGMAAEDAGQLEEAMELLKKLVALPLKGDEKDMASLQAMAQKRLEKLRSAAPPARPHAP